MLECPGLVGVFFVGMTSGVGLYVLVDRLCEWFFPRGRKHGASVKKSVGDWNKTRDSFKGNRGV